MAFQLNSLFACGIYNFFCLYFVFVLDTVTPRSDDGSDENSTSEDTPQRPHAAPSEKREPVIVTTTTAATPQQK